ncbi:nitrilase-related carbon-nitrogen hydrolase [Thermodesulfobacteriota bacterium]
MKPIKLAAVQFTPEFNQKEDNLARIQNLTEGLDADIIVLPELCTSGYFYLSREEVAAVAEPAGSTTTVFFQDMANRLDAIVVAGFAESDGEKLYNSCLIVQPEKRPRIYRKIHLFYKEKYCFDPGDLGFFVIEDHERNLRLGPMICYDWRFPEAARILTLLGADVIACPSNLVTDAWRLVVPVRAIENKVYIAVANRAGTEKRGDEELLFKGNSTIYGYNGQELRKAGPVGDEILQVVIIPQKTRDKFFNPINDILKDRQPHHYGPLVDKS